MLNGRYGPYITDGKRNARMPKDTDPKSIALELCRELLAVAPLRGSRFGRKKTADAGKSRSNTGSGKRCNAPSRAKKSAAKSAQKSDSA